MKKRFIEIIVHGIFWAATTWLLTNSFTMELRLVNIIDGEEKVNIVRNGGMMLQILSCIVAGAIVFYTTVWLLLRGNEIKKQVILLLLGVFGTGILGAYVVSITDFDPRQTILLSL